MTQQTLNDLKLIFTWFLDLFPDIWDLVMGSILVITVVLFVIAYVIKIFKRLIR